nr:MAG TPA: hypothetical protein [Caudoviricetes sp.]
MGEHSQVGETSVTGCQAVGKPQRYDARPCGCLDKRCYTPEAGCKLPRNFQGC